MFASTTTSSTLTPNPVLVAFRERGDSEYPGEWLSALDALRLFGGYIEWDNPRSYFHPLTLATQEQARHARKVLTRLADAERETPE